MIIMFPTLEDVARKAGVSARTVSRVINGEPWVNEVTREKVLRVIEELGYRPNSLARGLKKAKNNVVGYVLPDMSSQFFGSIGRVIEKILRKAGYSLIVSSTDNKPSLEAEALHLLIDQRVSGIILASLGHLSDSAKSFLQALQIPIVVIDNEVEGLRSDVVLHDNLRGSYLLTRHLIEHGHTRIAFIGGPLNQTSGALRLAGYRMALEEVGISYDDGLVKIGDWQTSSGYELTLELINTASFTALFSANFDMALGVLKAFQRKSISIPEEIALVAFDGLGLAQFTNPPLTTLKDVERKIGIIAARLLLGRIENPDRFRKELKVVVPVELCVRRSCGCYLYGSNKDKTTNNKEVEKC